MDLNERINILLQSYEILVKDIRRNDKRIRELLEKIAKYDIQMMIKLWIDIIDNRANEIYDSSSLTSGVLYDLKELKGDDFVIELLKNNNKLKTFLFNKSEDVYHFLINVILEKKDFTECKEILELIYKNKNKEETFDYYFEEIIGYTKIDEEIAQFAFQWLDKIESQDVRAAITVKLIEFL